MPPPTRTSVEIVEVGPRDGLQNEDRPLDVDTRVALVHELADLGLHRIEVASFVRPDRVPQMAGAEEVVAQTAGRRGLSTIGLVLNRRGAERAVATACHELNVVLPVTDEFAVRNQGATVDSLLVEAAAAVRTGHDAGRRTTVTLAVAFGCPFSGEVLAARVGEVLDRVADWGVDELALADTIGVGTPRQVGMLAGLVPQDRVPALRFHFHNTRNTGYANAFAATLLDGRAFGGGVALDASVGGFGGCPFAPAATGNIATEDLAYLLRRDGVPTRPGTIDVAGLADVAIGLGARLDSPVTAQLGRAGDFGVRGARPGDQPR